MLGNGVKKLGFGMMRLPKIDDAFDLDQIKKMVDLFLEEGCTYFDTAWAYDGSEEVTRKALVERYPRDRFLLATKLAVWDSQIKTREDAIAEFDTSLERTGAGYFDYYLLHNLCGNTRVTCEKFGLWDFISEKKAAGLIRHIGFSFHGTPDELDDILNTHPETEFVQLQINYADWDDPKIASRACYENVCRHNLPVIIMEPVKGGLLATPPKSVQAALSESGSVLSPAAHAIRFAAGLPSVLTVLSGMSTIEQMEDNLAAIRRFKRLSEKEKEAVEKAKGALKAIPLITCTGCDYCAKVCMQNIGISGAFRSMNSYTLYHNAEKAKDSFEWYLKDNGKASPRECISCGACESTCPQHLPIPQLLKKLTKELGL